MAVRSPTPDQLTPVATEKKRAATELLEGYDTLSEADFTSRLRTLGFREFYTMPGKEARPLLLMSQQLEALRFVLRARKLPGHEQVSGVLLAMEMGLGKTLVCICMLVILKQAGIAQTPALILCSKTLMQWAREICSTFGSELRVVLAPQYSDWRSASNRAKAVFDRRFQLSSVEKRCDVVITTYEALAACHKRFVGDVSYPDGGQEMDGPAELMPFLHALRDCGYARDTKTTELSSLVDWYASVNGSSRTPPIPTWSERVAKKVHPMIGTKWSTVIYDESHLARTLNTERYRACRFLHADYVLLCTGTVVINSLKDEWTQLSLCRCPHVHDLSMLKTMYRDVNDTDPNNRLKLLLACHKFVKKLEEVGKVDVDRLAPREMPTNEQGPTPRPDSPFCLSMSSPSSSSSSSMSDGEVSWQSSDVVIRHTDVVPEALKACGWQLFSPGINGVLAADGKTYVYDTATRGIPPVYSRVFELETGPELTGVVNHFTARLKEAVARVATATGESTDVLTDMNDLRQVSESVRYPSKHLRGKLRGMEDADWEADMTHPKPAFIAQYVKDFLAPGEKLAVFCHFTGGVRDYIEYLEAQKIKCITMTGQTPPGERDELLMRACNDPNVKVLVCTRIIDLGWNLQQFNHAMFATPWWQAENDAQAIKRFARPGQTRPCYASWLILRTSGAAYAIEKMMVERCISKQNVGKQTDALAKIFAQQARGEVLAAMAKTYQADVAAAASSITSPIDLSDCSDYATDEAATASPPRRESLKREHPDNEESSSSSNDSVSDGVSCPPRKRTKIEVMSGPMDSHAFPIPRILAERCGCTSPILYSSLPNHVDAVKPHSSSPSNRVRLTFDWPTGIECYWCKKPCAPRPCTRCRIFVYCSVACRNNHAFAGHAESCLAHKTTLKKVADRVCADVSRMDIRLTKLPGCVAGDFVAVEDICQKVGVPLWSAEYAALADDERTADDKPVAISPAGVVIVRFDEDAEPYAKARDFLQADAYIAACAATFAAARLMIKEEEEGEPVREF